jgi:hypothetical protein
MELVGTVKTVDTVEMVDTVETVEVVETVLRVLGIVEVTEREVEVVDGGAEEVVDVPCCAFPCMEKVM